MKKSIAILLLSAIVLSAFIACTPAPAIDDPEGQNHITAYTVHDVIPYCDTPYGADSFTSKAEADEAPMVELVYLKSDGSSFCIRDVAADKYILSENGVRSYVTDIAGIGETELSVRERDAFEVLSHSSCTVEGCSCSHVITSKEDTSKVWHIKDYPSDFNVLFSDDEGNIYITYYADEPAPGYHLPQHIAKYDKNGNSVCYFDINTVSGEYIGESDTWQIAIDKATQHIFFVTGIGAGIALIEIDMSGK